MGICRKHAFALAALASAVATAAAAGCDSGYSVDPSADAANEATSSADAAGSSDGSDAGAGTADASADAQVQNDASADADPCGKDLTNDPANCGACGHVCNGDGGCASGECIHIMFVADPGQSSTANLGGIAGADKICQEAAKAAGLNNQFLAWLGASTTSPSARFVKGKRPYRLPLGTEVAADYAGLTSGMVMTPIAVDALGNATPVNHVWTSVAPNGTYDPTSAGTCGDWTSIQQSGAIGNAGSTSASWTQGGMAPCSSHSGIYCVEQ